MDSRQKEKFGEWPMDIAKYILTALVLSSLLTKMSDPAVMVCVITVGVFLFAIGLILIRKED